MTKPLRYAHAGDLQTNEVLDLVWQVGCDNDRFQEIAICDDKVIGSWSYTVNTKGSRYWIDSSHTDVAPRFRKRGIASQLWRRGIARWNPTRIKATIATSEGRALLAHMFAELRYSHPSLYLDVSYGSADNAFELWREAQFWACESMLKRLHDRDAAKNAAKKPVAQLTAIAGGKP